VCHKDKEPAAFPSKRTYQVPDFVFFSHAKHTAAKVECASCHGMVYETELAKPATLPRMDACVDCHKSRGATIVCTACHELSQ
jgi:hypothetical protein